MTMTRFLSPLLPRLFSRPRQDGAAGAPALPVANTADCFHCGLPLPLEGREWVEFDGAHHPVCCTACRAIVGVVLANGMGDYYRERDRRALLA